ncbi:MAG: MarR family transcriptional regulator [Bacillota bacterium]|nr:MarR family transcriptional regulator [Bacillota bacterium]MDW7678480.1 MarR family transcriptional regulator [Bacillota bacterium]
MDSTPTQEHINESLKLFVVLSRAAKAVSDRIEENIRSYGLNSTEFAVLELLYHKGSQSIQIIGKKVLIASSSITYVVDKMVSRGYVSRTASPYDRRVIFAELTPEGKDLMDRIFPGHALAIHRILEGVPSHEKPDMIEQLKKIGFYAQQMKGK